MNEENTKDRTVNEKLDMLLSDLTFVKADLTFVKAELTAVKTDLTFVKAELTSVKTEFGARLAKVEAFIEDRSRDTRPMLDKVYKEVADIGIEVKEIKDRVVRIDRKFDVLNSDVVELRAADREFEQRLTVVGRQAA